MRPKARVLHYTKSATCHNDCAIVAYAQGGECRNSDAPSKTRMPNLLDQLDRASVSACPLCGSSKTVRFASRARFGRIWHIAECSGCKLVFTDPQPSDADIRTFYEADYHSEL